MACCRIAWVVKITLMILLALWCQILSKAMQPIALGGKAMIRDLTAGTCGITKRWGSLVEVIPDSNVILSVLVLFREFWISLFLYNIFHAVYALDFDPSRWFYLRRSMFPTKERIVPPPIAPLWSYQPRRVCCNWSEWVKAGNTDDEYNNLFLEFIRKWKHALLSSFSHSVY